MRLGLLRSTLLAGFFSLVMLVGCAPGRSSTATPDQAISQTPVSAATQTKSGRKTTTAPTAITLEPTAAEATATPTGTGRFVAFDEQLASVGFTLPLTIQHLSQNAAWLYFELEQPVEGELFYWIDGQETSGVYTVQFTAEARQHLIELTDLLPDTRYVLRVGLDGSEEIFRSPGLNGEVWGDTSLTTYPQEIKHLRIAVIGDSGFGESITYALSALIAAREPDFVIHTGDVIYSAFENGTPLRAYQAKYFWPFQKVLLQAPIYPVPGNHDYYDDASIGGAAYYFSVFPSLGEHVTDGSWVESGQPFRNWYAIRLMNYQFVFLESQRFYRSEAVSEETDWLGAVLAEFPGPTVGVFHIAAYTSGNHERDGLPIQSSWLPQFRDANTALILSGHDHNYERLNVDGLDFIVSGGGSGILYGLDQPVDGSKVFAAESHFVLLDIYPDRIEVEAVNAYGDVIDRATLNLDS